MFLRTEILPSKKFIGQKITMNYANNLTGQLWRNFMPFKKEIQNTIGQELYSIEIYPEHFFDSFNPTVNFDKWAAVEVSQLDAIPENMQTLIVPEGKYAVFHYKGKPENAPAFFNNIFTNWLPEQKLEVDNRPHLAIMGEKYKNNSDDSEEEIWIPVRELRIDN